MKQTLLLLLIFGFRLAAPAWAQQALLTERPLSPIEQVTVEMPSALARPASTGLATREVSYRWERSTQQWDSGYLSIHTYDTMGRRVQTIVTDSATGRSSSRSTYTYDLQGRQTQVAYETWTGMTWQNSFRESNRYDSRGNLVQRLQERGLNGAWVNEGQGLSEYDARDNLIDYRAQVWQPDNTWRTTYGYRQAYTYDAAGAMLTLTNERWDSMTQTFVPAWRYIFTPDPLYRWQGYIFQVWVSGAYANIQRVHNVTWATPEYVGYSETQRWNGTTWQDSLRMTITFPAPAPSSISLTEKRVGSTWQNAARTIMRYDASSNFLGFERQSWRATTWGVDEGYQYLLRYNTNNQLVRRLGQVFSASLQIYQNNDRYHYGNFLTGPLGTAPAALAAAATLYPNPAAGSATLLLRGLDQTNPVTVIVLDLLGRSMRTLVVYPQHGTLRAVLDLSTLPAGSYLVRLQTAKGSIIKRLMRECN